MTNKKHNYQLKYNDMETGKVYFNISDAKKEQKRLEKLGLWGYKVCLINNEYQSSFTKNYQSEY